MNDTLYTIKEFNEFVSTDLNGFVYDVCSKVNNRRPTEDEIRAMMSSYPEVSKMLACAVEKNPALSDAHIGVSMIKFEYKLPSAPAWCDLVILGANGKRNETIIIELKDWYANSSDTPGVCEGIIQHDGKTQEHPSDQVKSYSQYCQNFHSAVIETDAEVSGCVFFTRNINVAPYCAEPNDTLTKDYPVFNRNSLDDLADYVCEKVKRGDDAWATKFVDGYYRQNRNILKQVAQSFKANSDERPFVLLGAQRTGFHKVLHQLSLAVCNKEEKRVIVVSGPPGSGKSAIALNLWAEAVKRYVDNPTAEHPGNVVFVSTSSSQNDNWKSIFERYSDASAAGGLVMRSNNFNPGMTGGTMKRVFLPIFREKSAKYLKDEKSLKYEYFRDYTNYMLANGMAKGYRDNLHFLSIIDEAHALINPLAEGFSTNSLGGWCMQMGPQAYHIIRESRVSVFLMDPEQPFRDNETTSIQDILKYGRELGASVEVIDLAGLQFRCAGSAEYVDWVEGLFSRHPAQNIDLWKSQFEVAVFDTTHEMEADLRKKHSSGKCVRLLSSCSVPWISSKSLDEMHSKGEIDCDFDFLNEDGVRFLRHWNNPKRMDIFVQAPPFTKMHEDPLCEVGCPYEIRGFDFDFVGLLWLGDVVWRKDRWYVDISKAVDRANKSSAAQARKEQEAYSRQLGYRGSKVKEMPLIPLDVDSKKFPKTAAFFKTIVQTYRILMTRAVRGVGLYIRDRETRKHVREMLRVHV